jgi:type IV pilus assembly protein PilB
MRLSIGQILVENGVLNQRQVEKIAEQQRSSRQRFGQVAVALGWAKPADVWEAWAAQLTAQDEVIDLDALGVDSAATERVPPAVAWHYQVIAVRSWGDNLVLAVPKDLADRARQELPALLGANLFFCVAGSQQVRAALQRMYAVAAS